MTFPRRSLRDLRNPIGCLILLAAFAAAAGCSTSTTGGSLVDAAGNHPANFVSIHPDYARPDGSLCMPCHGDDLRGGISKVSCFSASFNGVGCHANGPAFHPALWLDKAKKGSATDGKPDFHGTGYTTGYTISGLACSDCHDLNEKCTICHFNIQGTQRVPTGSTYVHGQIAGHTAFGQLDTPNDNNSVCINCHDTNNRFGLMPQPFCHNCHSPAPPGFHPAGWSAPAQHGATAKKRPGAGTGFPSCQSCHGIDFRGDVANGTPSCVNNQACHGPSGIPGATDNALSPHSPRPWRTAAGSQYNHTTTSSDNATAAVCYACHKNRQNFVGTVPNPSYPGDGVPAGCFNNTLCHGAVGHGDDPGWISPLPGNHGKVARNDLSVCQACHATPVSGGPNPRFNVAIGTLQAGCEGCHKAFTAHAPATLSGYRPHWDNHAASGKLNTVCTLCHGSSLLGGVGPACTLCHASTPVNLATGAPVTGCVSCHANVPNGPNGTQYPNIAGAHRKHIGDLNVVGNYGIACASCHNGLGSPTTSHYDRAVPPRSEPASVAFAAAFNTTFALTGTSLGFNSSLASLSCSNVSCHGGQPTPTWRAAPGSILCTNCHGYRNGQYNSYTSNPSSSDPGPHHTGEATCTDCHSVSRLADNTVGRHFATLGTKVMEVRASVTIGGPGTLIESYVPNTGVGGSCTPTCHGAETWVP